VTKNDRRPGSEVGVGANRGGGGGARSSNEPPAYDYDEEPF